MKTYTQQEIIEMFGFTMPRLTQLRNGYTLRPTKGGKKYNIDPRLIKGEHWWYEDRYVVYSESALPILQAVVNDRK